MINETVLRQLHEECQRLQAEDKLIPRAALHAGYANLMLYQLAMYATTQPLRAATILYPTLSPQAREIGLAVRDALRGTQVSLRSREATSARSCGRQPADHDGTERGRAAKRRQRGAVCCRAFAALRFVTRTHPRFTPWAACWRRFAAAPDLWAQARYPPTKVGVE